jgi:hypothetical protein
VLARQRVFKPAIQREFETGNGDRQPGTMARRVQVDNDSKFNLRRAGPRCTPNPHAGFACRAQSTGHGEPEHLACQLELLEVYLHSLYTGTFA